MLFLQEKEHNFLGALLTRDKRFWVLFEAYS